MISKLLKRFTKLFEPKQQEPVVKPIQTVAFIDADGVSKSAEKVVLRVVEQTDKIYVVKTYGGSGSTVDAEQRRLKMMFGDKAEIILFDAVGKEAVDKIIAMRMADHMAKGVRKFVLISHDADFIDVSVYGKRMYADIDTTMIVINDGNKEKVQSLIKKCRAKKQKYFIVGLNSTLKKINREMITDVKVKGPINKETMAKILAIVQPHVGDDGKLSKTHFKWLMKHNGIYTGTRHPHQVQTALNQNGFAVYKDKGDHIHFPQFVK